MQRDDREPNASLGLIGLGLLGSALARRWLAAGWRVRGFDLQPERRAELTAAGGEVVSEVEELGEGDAPLVCCLPNSDIVTQVLESLEPGMPAGKLVVDSTTGTPEVAERWASRLAQRDVRWLDATIAGSSQQVTDGEAVVLVGGQPADFALGNPLLSSLAPQVFHLGPAGSGARMKLVVNLAIGLQRLVLAEALALADACGFSRGTALEILRVCPSYSRAMDIKGRKMVELDFTPQARLAQHLKDVQLILAAAAERHQTLPLSNCHVDILASLVQQGYGDLDNSAVLLHYL